jgi:hypothetical protein
VSPNTGSRWGAVGPYERVAVLLAEALRTGDTPVEAGRKAVAGTVPDAVAGGDPLEVVADVMARSGLDPAVRRRGGRVEVLLRAYPFEVAAVADPAVICAVHLGMAEGIAELTDGRLSVDGLVPHDPRRHACRLYLRPGGDAHGEAA